MKCRYCGAAIPDGALRCSRCGNEVRIVPDYNPLDDMLTAHIRGAISEEDEGYEEYMSYVENEPLRNRVNNVQRNNVQRNSAQRNNAQRNSTGRTQHSRSDVRRSGAGRTNTGTGRSAAANSRDSANRSMTPEERERRRRRAEKRREMKRRKRRRLIMIMLLILVAIIGGGVLIYQNSYTGIVKKGYKAISKSEYDNAAAYFNKAIKKNQKKANAYSGLAQVYMSKGDADSAEKVFTDAIEAQPDNADIYEACIQFYIDSEQQAEIPLLLDEASDAVVSTLSDYVVKVPKFSLDDTETFDDVQEVSLSAGEGDTIYYTTDGKNPTIKSKKYSKPIQLSEGKTTVKAIAVNSDGIPSMAETKKYKVELPVEDAPAVSPSTGQYTTATKIQIKVPDGYEAYYTMDGTDPTTASYEYTEPIDMPEGETIFKAVLINKKGKTSGITTRNYTLESVDGSSDSSTGDWYGNSDINNADNSAISSDY